MKDDLSNFDYNIESEDYLDAIYLSNYDDVRGYIEI